ncbi:MAG: carbamate kinase [Gammaproteobacteria bacterium]
MPEGSDSSRAVGSRPLMVLALGGNALSPPGHASEDYGVERRIVARTALMLNRLAAAGHRLLIVHGNGPQVGRLLRQDPAHGNLDIHVAQTQGELGYLLTAAMDESSICVLTRVVVGADPGPPVKPIGPVLATPPPGAEATRSGSGWRRLVPSPRPERVVEEAAIARLLADYHVIAAGGGGVPLNPAGTAVEGVVDKDWAAALLAVTVAARHLVFATDVAGVYRNPEQTQGEPIAELGVDEARALVDAGAAMPGSMAPKLESAAEFATATGRTAHICALDRIEAALAGRAGTRVRAG